MWYLYELKPSNKIKKAASDINQRIVNQQYTTDNHDVGFIINCSFGNKYRLLGLEEDKQIMITAAKLMSIRFIHKTGCIRSWNNKKWQNPITIDNMMNLEIAEFIANNKNLPEDKIPYSDFEAPDIRNTLRDTSASAVMAWVFMELSTFIKTKLSENYYEIT